MAWLYNIYLHTGIKVPFPVVADRDASIARKFGMISPDVSNTEAVRNVYVIDENDIIRCILVYPLTTGRYIPEILRIIDSLKLHDKENIVTPANWFPNNPVIVPPPQTMNELYNRINSPKELNCMDWYLCYKEK